jgi:broad specificity phosphatase PhoE
MSKGKVHMLRHAQSEANIGIEKLDPHITDEGKRQASKMYGEYDLVIISPLIRTLQTLLHSNIKYEHIFVTELCREVRDGAPSNHILDEDYRPESYETFRDRVNDFRKLIRKKAEKHQRILVITHGVFMCHFAQLPGG